MAWMGFSTLLPISIEKVYISGIFLLYVLILLINKFLVGSGRLFCILAVIQ